MRYTYEALKRRVESIRPAFFTGTLQMSHGQPAAPNDARKEGGSMTASGPASKSDDSLLAEVEITETGCQQQVNGDC